MLPSYHDVLDRIEEEPTWFTEKGYPRYGEFKPSETNIYARYGVLFELGCQGCPDKINVGVDFDTSFDMSLVAIDIDLVNEYRAREDKSFKTWPITPNDPDGNYWMSIFKGVLLPHKLDDEGKSIYKTLSLEEVIHRWGMGDPPHHGCFGAGETMSSFPLRTLEVWDRHFGQVVEDGIIKVWGEKQRIPELENIDLADDWVKENYVT